jgi:hypothetical protein
VPTAFAAAARQLSLECFLKLEPDTFRRNQMPVILWLLGVPLGIVLLLMLFGVL